MNELYQTFVSKRLNETIFDIKIADSNDYVTIATKEKDFYFPLISGLNTFQEYRLAKNMTIHRNELAINDDESTIRFYYKLTINDTLRINYLERNVFTWEERNNLGNSIYYFFNKDNIISDNSLVISPKLFAFNIPKQEDYVITILHRDEKQKYYLKSNLTNCTNQTNNILEQQCLISYNLTNNKAQSVIIIITDNINNFYEYIDFVYYHLDENSKKCQTINSNMNNITLLVEIPNSNLKNKIKLNSPDTDIIEEKRSNNMISFILNGNKIDLQYTFLQLFTDNGELDHWFTLQDLGINILPKYKMRFNNNKKITYLLPEDNQIVKVIIFVENNEIINLDDISGFIIKGEKNKNLAYQVGKNFIKGEPNTLKLIFNLLSVDKSEQSHLLYYIDRCGKEFQTDLKVSFISFNFRRKYFVLKNNKNLKYQLLMFDGPVDDKISISVYKNGEYKGEAISNGTNYYLNFSQSSQGNYTFRVINDGIDSSMNEIIYVRENLEEILVLKNNISNCMFSNENKSAIKDFSFTITPSNINTNFRDFQSYFTSDQKTFMNLASNIAGKEKTFSIIYLNEMKKSINLNNTLYIYLVENNDANQPIYIFNYSYTNIELHPDFTKLIYTDADYILFKMKCKINNMKNFELSSTHGNIYSLACEDRGINNIFNEDSNIFKCYLSSNDNNKNRLLDFGKTIFEYGNFNLKYEQITITNEPFFLSQDIYTSDFSLIMPDIIGRNVTININITTNRKTFYFPEISKVTYYRNKVKEYNIDFKYNNNNYISFALYIENHANYNINKICRKSCIYCRNNDCQLNDCQLLNKIISSNTPEIYFNFDKHYISLENSTYKNNEKDSISTLTITSNGDSMYEIQNLIYYHYANPTNIIESGVINGQNNIYKLTLSKGKYKFQYRYKNINFDISDIVLVTTYDYEMFDFSDFSSKCFFYDLDLTSSGLLVSINH